MKLQFYKIIKNENNESKLVKLVKVYRKNVNDPYYHEIVLPGVTSLTFVFQNVNYWSGNIEQLKKNDIYCVSDEWNKKFEEIIELAKDMEGFIKEDLFEICIGIAENDFINANIIIKYNCSKNMIDYVAGEILHKYFVSGDKEIVKLSRDKIIIGKTCECPKNTTDTKKSTNIQKILNNQIGALENLNGMFYDHNKILIKTNKELKSENTTLRQSIGIQYDRFFDQNDIIKELENKISILTENEKELKKTIKMQINSLTNRGLLVNKVYMNKIDELEKENEELKTKKAELIQENIKGYENLRYEVAKLSLEKQELQDRYEKLRKENEVLESGFDEVEDSLDNLENDFARLRNENKEIRRCLSKSGARRTELKKESQKLKDEIDDLQAKNLELIQEKQILEKEKERFKMQQYFDWIKHNKL